MKGYAQRTSNEWPAVGLSVPAWLSDFSNDLMVKGNANLVRWMHVTPWKQDVESMRPRRSDTGNACRMMLKKTVKDVNGNNGWS